MGTGKQAKESQHEKNWNCDSGIHAAVLCAPAAMARNDVKAGVLTCRGVECLGIHIGFDTRPALHISRHEGRHEYYAGHISKFGVDIGYTRAAVLVWGVLRRLQRSRPVRWPATMQAQPQA
jgi:hypothetical protein